MVCWSMENIAAVAPYSGAMLEMVARSPRVSAAAPSPWNSSQAPTTFDLRRNSVSASTVSVAVMPGCGLPVNCTPTISGRRIHDARPSITLSASSPPTPIAITPKASTCGVWLSVPTQVSGNATPPRAWTTGDIFSRLIWCMIPLPGGITSMFLNALRVHSMKWKRSSLRRSSMARFLANASGSKPPHSTASEWSTISCTGTTGLTCAGSPPCSAMASRRPARSTSAVWPRMSWQTTRAGNQGKSRSRLRSISCFSESVSVAGSQRRTRFSASTREVYGNVA